MTNPDPGWYPDPLGLWDLRWWDGRAWNETVRTGTHQDVEPIAPIEQLAADVPAAGVVWQSAKAVDPIHGEQYLMTGESLRVYTNLSKPPKLEWQLWTIARAEPRVTGGQSLMGVGDVVLTISFEGFAGRSTEVLQRVPEPARAAALICRYSRLARRVAGIPEPSVPGR